MIRDVAIEQSKTEKYLEDNTKQKLPNVGNEKQQIEPKEVSVLPNNYISLIGLTGP